VDVESIGIRELRQHASRYLALVKKGRRIAVTERGRLVAYLVPADESGSVLGRLAAVGQFRPPAGHITDLFPVPSPPAGKRPLSEVLQQLRDEETA
jgi:prevent-host-death family protein